MLAEIVNGNQMFIECEEGETKDMIVEELEQVKQFNMDKDGKKRIIPKDKVKKLIGRSPDYSDLLMMRMWFALGYRINFLSIYS